MRLYWLALKKELHIQNFQARLIRVVPKISGQWDEEKFSIVLFIARKVSGAEVDDHPAFLRIDCHTHSHLPQPALLLQMARQLGANLALKQRQQLGIGARVFRCP